ncbi:hypothetical protein B0H19DRAFT_985476 [Mycena capillaripes]|nr:hypothetical protein B0H19DRAFT_985476 [Mycena capillaripes]
MDSDVTSEPIEPRRVQELWFRDGNLVLQAGNSRYRVYLGFLAARSYVFQNMFAFPQLPGSELVEGCRLVRLPDPDVQVTPFLKAIFDSKFFVPFPAPTDFDAIVGCLRLGHKYGVDYLYRRALVHLSSGYSTTLAQDDLINDYQLENDCVPSALERRSWEIPDDPAYSILAIQLARETGATWILPKAFYDLSATFSKLGTTIFHGAVYRGVPTHLSLQDQISLLKGHDVQRSATVADGLGFLLSPFIIQGCVDPPLCLLERLDSVECYNTKIIHKSPLSLLDMWGPEDWRLLQDLCSICLAVLKSQHKDSREGFWAILPEIYDLPSWERLEQMKATAIGTNLPA